MFTKSRIEVSFLDNGQVHVLGFSGSLRKNSLNTAALRAAVEVVPEGVILETFDLSSIPLFNEDLEKSAFPQSVQEFKDKIAQAEALLIVTPEYNYSIPGVLKNALDWASRPPGDNSLNGKPVAIMGASMGYFGTARAQYHLRQVCVCVNMVPLNKPEVFIPLAAGKFDPQGKLTDEDTKKRIAQLLSALAQWTKQLNK